MCGRVPIWAGITVPAGVLFKGATHTFLLYGGCMHAAARVGKWINCFTPPSIVLWHWSFPPLKRSRAGPGVAAFLLSIIPYQSHAQTWWGQLFCSSVQVDTYQNIFYGGCPADNDDADGLGGPLSVHFIWKHAKTEVTFYQYTWVVIEDSFPS